MKSIEVLIIVVIVCILTAFLAGCPQPESEREAIKQAKNKSDIEYARKSLEASYGKTISTIIMSPEDVDTLIITFTDTSTLLLEGHSSRVPHVTLTEPKK